jgi:16S rRNA (cytosine1402-N4)-methyltransferase
MNPASPNQISPRHIPVLGHEAVAMLAPRSGGIYVDATFGAGGYSRAILDIAGTQVIGIDRDRTAIAGGFDLVEGAEGRLTLVEDRFSHLAEICAGEGFEAIDGVVIGVGVSSMQLDEAGRGFSFRLDGPLDMRMGGEGPSAVDLVNEVPAAELARIFRTYGEEREGRRIASAIVRRRAEQSFSRTLEFAEFVERTLGGRRGAKIHPATRVFQALRIAVNAELEELELGLLAAEQVLKAGGRLAVVTFHSLEDRIVKTFLAERSGRNRGVSRHVPPAAEGPAPSFELLFNGHRAAGPAETAANPRARSAKLRAATRTAAPAWRAAA